MIFLDKIAKRSDKIAFFGIKNGENTEYKRMRGFTELSINKNPVEYQRRYIDEKTERNDVVGYAPSISYSFDKFSDDLVHQDIIAIADNELIGTEAVRSILLVDISKASDDGSFPAILRNWAVIPDSEGNDSEAYTYSGTLKSNGDIIKGQATTNDDWQSCQFTAI